MTIDETIAKLSTIHEEFVPTQWEWIEQYQAEQFKEFARLAIQYWPEIVKRLNDRGGEDKEMWSSKMKGNGDYIAVMHEAFPALLEELRAFRDEVGLTHDT